MFVDHTIPCGMFTVPLHRWVLLKATCERLGLEGAVGPGWVHSWVPGLLRILELARRDPSHTPRLVLRHAPDGYVQWVAQCCAPLGVAIAVDGSSVFHAA